jgi:hypothetical protein
MGYPKHYTFKKNRLIRLDMVNGKCEMCGVNAQHVHHVDGNKGNHNVNNLMAVCCKCHAKFHKHPWSCKSSKNEKCIRRFNYSEIAKFTGVKKFEIVKYFRPTGILKQSSVDKLTKFMLS